MRCPIGATGPTAPRGSRCHLGACRAARAGARSSAGATSVSTGRTSCCAWAWRAGVGSGAGGEQVAWNLVAGIHDAPRASERTVWVDGAASEVAPVAFAPGLDAVGDLRFEAEAERVRRDDLVLLASDYRQPFGTFTGTLPDGTELAAGYGVMERHAA